MPKRILYENKNGGLSVVVPVDPKIGLDFILEKSVPKGIPFTIVESDEIPTDRTFREAWKHDHGKGVEIDMDIARDIQMDIIRKARDKALVDKDIEWQIAFEKSDFEEAERIAVEKQALRDIPQNFDLTVAKTSDELKALWPDQLKRMVEDGNHSIR